MRIIAGEFRRRLLKTPPDDTITRPIPDRVKESLFAMLSGNCVDANVFDAFAGTGAIGLEAISRGAAQCLFIERDASIAKILQANIDELGVGDRCEVMQTDALGAGALARAPRPLHLAFLDPPYPLVRDPLGFRRVMAQAAGLIQILEPDGFLILRTPHPLLLEVGGVPAVDADADAPGKPGKPRRGKFGKGKKRNWREERDEATRYGSAGAPGFGAAKVDPSKFGAGSTGSGNFGSGQFGSGQFGSGRFDPDQDPFEVDEDDDLGLDGADGASASEEGDNDSALADPQAAAPRPEPVPADLSIPGAIGPETHVYHGMAVHLYARAKS